MKSCVFSLFTFQMASQFPKRDNHSAEHVWFLCVLFPIFLYYNESPTHFDSIIENALPWVMGHMGHGSSIQWVTWIDHGSLEVTHRLPCVRALKQQPCAPKSFVRAHARVCELGSTEFLPKLMWNHYSAAPAGSPISMKFCRMMQNKILIMNVGSKWKPEVELQYGER